MQVRFELDEREIIRIQRATERFNRRENEQLSAKRWMLLQIREAVVGELMGEEVTSAVKVTEASIRADQIGEG